MGSVSIEYDSSTDFGTGHSGLYADVTSVTFDDFRAHDTTARNPLVPRFVGAVDASISSGELLVQGQTRGGEAIFKGFADDAYMVKLDVDLNSGTHADLWVRYSDANNGYKLTLDSGGVIELFKVHLGKSTSLASGAYTPAESVTSA